MKIIISVVIMAAATYLIRALPIALFRRRIKSRFIRSFLYYVPYAVLGAMTFPAILYSTGNIVTASIGTATAMILAFFEKSLVVVALGSMVVVYLSAFIFI